MAGIVYKRSGTIQSLTGSEYTAVTPGNKTLYLQTGANATDRIAYGLTTDVTASGYSPAFMIAGTKHYIAKVGTDTGTLPINLTSGAKTKSFFESNSEAQEGGSGLVKYVSQSASMSYSTYYNTALLTFNPVYSPITNSRSITTYSNSSISTNQVGQTTVYVTRYSYFSSYRDYVWEYSNADGFRISLNSGRYSQTSETTCSINKMAGDVAHTFTLSQSFNQGVCWWPRMYPSKGVTRSAANFYGSFYPDMLAPELQYDYRKPYNVVFHYNYDDGFLFYLSAWDIKYRNSTITRDYAIKRALVSYTQQNILTYESIMNETDLTPVPSFMTVTRTLSSNSASYTMGNNLDPVNDYEMAATNKSLTSRSGINYVLISGSASSATASLTLTSSELGGQQLVNKYSHYGTRISHLEDYTFTFPGGVTASSVFANITCSAQLSYSMQRTQKVSLSATRIWRSLSVTSATTRRSFAATESYSDNRTWTTTAASGSSSRLATFQYSYMPYTVTYNNCNA